jgi:hypothetical protein
MPALIAAKASSSLMGVGVHVILMSPCYERARAVSRCKEGTSTGWITYSNLGDDDARGCTTEFN